jgi:hypothetical protein
MKILIAVLATDKEPWDKLIKTIQQTWGSISIDNIKIIYYYGNPNKTNDLPIIEGNNLYSKYEETFENIGLKTIDMFKYAYENYEFDFLLRTNASSYINQEALINYLTNKIPKNYAGGFIGKIPNKFNFLSGSGYVLSRDLVNFIIKNSEKWDHSLIDDVALGQFLYENTNVKLQFHPRIDNNNKHKLIFNPNIFHFRCKCSDRNDDVIIIKSIHNIIHNYNINI